MKDYSTFNIRNVAVFGGSGCGKTSMIEAACFVSGLKNKLGSISEGTTVSDFDKEEISRGCSLRLSVVSVPFSECKINFIDTPGGLDYSGERQSAAIAADGAIIVINGKRGVDVGTKRAWELCEKHELPRMFFVTGMDDDDASYREIIEELNHLYGSRIAPFQMPIRAGQSLIGYADITRMVARKFNGVGRLEDIEIPEYCMTYLDQYKKILDEAVASLDEKNMEKYFSGDEFTQDEKECALRENCFHGDLVPVTMGSGLHVQGIYMLLDNIIRYLPAPIKTKVGIDVASNQMFDCIYDENDYLVAQVFKTITDPYIGKYSFVKVFSGTLTSEMNAFNPVHDTDQKIGRLYYINGKEFIPTDRIMAGDIGAIPKLTDVMTGDTLSTKNNPIKLKPINFEHPFTVKRYVTTDKNAEDKVYSCMLKMLDEDRTIQLINDTENGQQLIAGVGEQQLEVFAAQLFNKYKISIELSPVKVAYKETICKSATASGRYKKQSGGHGQFGDVVMTFEPSGMRDIPYIFEERIVGGAVPKNFFPAVEKGIEESVKAGLLAGYPVVGIRAILIDGSFHPVDSCENAFKMAAIAAFKDAFQKTEPILLEPIMAVKIYSPSKYTGDIISDLKSRRARIMGMVPENNETLIQADVPESELDGYLSKLRSISEGYARFEYEFSRYGQAPEEIVKIQVQNYKNS
jgi:elongation factor G